jgi:tetratricopeptide (TPR) repeat protein
MYYNRAKELFISSRLEEARFYIEKALKCMPEDARIMELFGRICLSQHNYEVAEQYFYRCFCAMPDDYKILFYYAKA